MSMHQDDFFGATYSERSQSPEPTVSGALCVAYAHSDMNKNGTLQLSTMTA